MWTFQWHFPDPHMIRWMCDVWSNVLCPGQTESGQAIKMGRVCAGVSSYQLIKGLCPSLPHSVFNHIMFTA